MQCHLHIYIFFFKKIDYNVRLQKKSLSLLSFENFTINASIYKISINFWNTFFLNQLQINILSFKKNNEYRSIHIFFNFVINYTKL